VLAIAGYGTEKQMIENLPFGKAVIVVENKKPDCCKGCYFWKKCEGECTWCWSSKRKDGKDVIFKLVDYPTNG